MCVSCLTRLPYISPFTTVVGKGSTWFRHYVNTPPAERWSYIYLNVGGADQFERVCITELCIYRATLPWMTQSKCTSKGDSSKKRVEQRLVQHNAMQI